MRSEFLVVAKKLMEMERKPLSPKELVDLAFEHKLFSDNIAGKTPHQTMKAKLSVHVRRKGRNSVFIRTSPGRFYLRSYVEDPSKIYEAKPLRPPAPKEYALVFPTKWLDDEGRFQGIDKNWQPLTKHLFNSRVCEYIDRREAEFADNYKQILTYIMVTRGQELLAFKRGSYTRSEEFLRGVHCVGFGGHVTALDFNLFHRNDYGIGQSAIRELAEEIKLPPKDFQRIFRGEAFKIVGLLNDDSSPNGERHFAFVFRYEVSEDSAWDKPQRNEKSITQLRWVDPMAPSQSLWGFEYWSQLCLLKFYQKTEITKPTFIIRRKEPLKPHNILVVLGPVGSGKSETTGVLKSDFGYVEINSGRILAKELAIQPVSEKNRESFQNAAFKYITQNNAPFKLAQAIWNRVRDLRCDRILVDGIRQKQTLYELRQMAKPRRVGILFVHTPPNMAFSFYRKRAGKSVSIHNFLRIRKNPVENEVEGMIVLADALLYNWSGQTYFRETIHEMMRDIGLRPVRK